MGVSPGIVWGQHRLSEVTLADSGGMREQTEITLGALDIGKYTLKKDMLCSFFISEVCNHINLTIVESVQPALPF